MAVGVVHVMMCSFKVECRNGRQIWLPYIEPIGDPMEHSVHQH